MALKEDVKKNFGTDIILSGNSIVDRKSIIIPVSPALDLVLQGADLEKPVLLKMDAEGHEPEVLLGAKNVFNQVDFVSIDCGAERSGKTTSSEVSNILSKYDFKNVIISERNIVTASKY